MRAFLRAVIIAAGLFWFFMGTIGIGVSLSYISPIEHIFSIVFLLVTTSLFFWFAIRLKKKEPGAKVSVKKEMIRVGKYWLVFFISAFIFSVLTMIFFPIGR